MSEIKLCLWKKIIEKEKDNLELKSINGLSTFTFKNKKIKEDCYNCNGYNINCLHYQQ